MDSLLGRLKSAGDKAGTSATAAQERVLQEYLPKIISMLKEKAGSAILDVFSDADKLGEVARGVYQGLPLPLRLVVKEESFIYWVVSRQNSIIDSLRSQLYTENSPEGAFIALPPDGQQDGTNELS
jgi:hypothetical protein